MKFGSCIYQAMPSSFTISVVLVAFATAATMAPLVDGARAFFVFGDSLVDNGNNNYLATVARADSPPYGIDYPGHRPTGRFSNGYNIPDLISQYLGAESTLAYLDPELRGEKLLVGANFASAGVGILNDTGIQFVNIIRIERQLQLFKHYQGRVSALIGEEQTKELVNKALVLITLGGNDYVNNYFLTPVNLRRLQYNLQDYSKFLISEYKKILHGLYDLGARRVLVTGIGPLGCVPGELAGRSINGECVEEPQRGYAIFDRLLIQGLYDLGARRVLVTGVGPLGCVPGELAGRSINGECVEEPQRGYAIFDRLLIQMISDLNRELGSDIFVAVNAGKIQNDFINNPTAYGFITSKVACCGQGPYNGVGLCTVASHLCENRDLYVFWDAFHPTERANKIIVQTIVNGSEAYMSPMNLSTILELDSTT